MKKILIFLLSLNLSYQALAHSGDVITIKITNQLKNSLQRTGASFACGSTQSLANPQAQEQIDCEYAGELYYTASLPDSSVESNAFTESTVIPYHAAETNGYARLGFQYSLTGKPRLGCSLIMDLTGDKVTAVHIQPLYPNPWVSCMNERTNNNILMVIKTEKNLDP